MTFGAGANANGEVKVWTSLNDRAPFLFSYTATVSVSNKVGRVTSQPIQVIVQSPIGDVTIEQVAGEPVVGYSVS